MIRSFLFAIAVAALAVLAPPVSAQTVSAQAVGAGAKRLVLHVDDNDPARMNLALNNASNVMEYYRARGEEVEIEIVAYGPGLHMLRADTSPVAARIRELRQNFSTLQFQACGNTQENMAKAEGRAIALVPEAKVVESGVVHLMERQMQGWTYVKP